MVHRGDERPLQCMQRALRSAEGLGRGRAPSLLLPVPSWHPRDAQGRGTADVRGGFPDLDPHKKKNLNILQS